MTHPLTKEEIDKAKQAQRQIIAECDGAIADSQHNIDVLQDLITQRNATKKLAQDTLADLSDDFPMVEGTTTAAGNPDAESIIDSSLIGSDVPLVSKTLKIRPDTTGEDSATIVEFNKDKGEVIVGKALKGGQVPKGVPFKILEAIPNEVV